MRRTRQVNTKRIGFYTPKSFNINRINRNPRLDALKASEVVYVGNKVNGVSFPAAENFIPKRLIPKFKEIKEFVFSECNETLRMPFLFGYEKGRYPYTQDYYDLYLKGFGWDCDLNNVKHNVQLLHHTRSFKMESSLSVGLKLIALKYHEFSWNGMQSWLRKARRMGGIPDDSLPLFVSLWSNRAGNRAPFEIGFHVEKDSVNELAKKFRLPVHTKSMFDHDHFVVIITYSWSGKPKKIKFYYKRGYVKEDFTYEKHLVYSPKEGRYFLYDLVHKKIVEEVNPDDYRR